MSPTISTPKTAIVLIDPYNDFIHPEGKLYGSVSESLTATNTVANLKKLVKAAREAHIPIYYALHKTWKEGNYMDWLHMNSSTTRLGQNKVFEEGTWGAEILEGLEPDVLNNGDVIVSKHWNSSSFANTDLDYQLHQREITHLVMAGMVANTCLESTARYGRELGYHVTLLTDGTAGFTTAAKDAAVDHVWPLIVEKVTTVGEWISTLKN
ncbi:Isochorismatase-like protein [Ilyonectria sp. MPI-CAGE-AT-0026]|nr:Isochorismatase-like protein [Ilyonectria sp. MPI-CAGE-AT-0026]